MGDGVIGRSGYGRWMALLLLPMAAACQQAPAGNAAAAPAAPPADAAMHAKAVAEPALATPVASADAAPAGLDPADAILAENDRAIAENRRMKQAIDGYRRTDGAKLDRLQAGCEGRLGAASDRDSAKRIFECVEAGW